MFQKEKIEVKDKIIVENILVEKFLEFLKYYVIVQMMNNVIFKFVFIVVEIREKYLEIINIRLWFQ